MKRRVVTIHPPRKLPIDSNIYPFVTALSPCSFIYETPAENKVPVKNESGALKRNASIRITPGGRISYEGMPVNIRKYRIRNN